MPDLNGIDVVKRILEHFPVPILMVTVYVSNQLAEAARSAGARGICATQDIGSIVQAEEIVLNHQTYFPPIASELGA